MDTKDLTKEDLEILIEAVATWESKDISSAMMSSMIGMMLAKDKEEAKRDTEEAFREAEIQKREKSEIATCLKAKLILIKSSKI